MGLKKACVVKGEKCLFLSVDNIKNVPADVLEKIATGKAKASSVVKKAEGPVLENILSLFYSDKGPKTKCHDYGFFCKPDGSFIFFALQGTSIKEVIL